MTIYVEGSFDVDIYCDVNGQWVSGHGDSPIEWSFTQSKIKASEQGLKTWSVKRQDEQLFSEEKDQAEWGRLQFTASGDVQHESGRSADLRRRFARTGTLQNENDGRFRQIMEDEPVFAFAKSFKLSNAKSSNSPNSDSVLFTISHVQDLVTQYASERGLTQMFPLWKSWFHDDEELIDFHYHDFDHAKALAANYWNSCASTHTSPVPTITLTLSLFPLVRSWARLASRARQRIHYCFSKRSHQMETAKLSMSSFQHSHSFCTPIPDGPLICSSHYSNTN